MQIAHEAPISLINKVRELTTLDFAIASYAYESEEYARMYATRSPWRVLILDNGKFELGAPLTPQAVLMAAHALRADYVIPPDHIDDFTKTRSSFLQFREMLQRWPRPALAPVIVGSSIEEMIRCYVFYREQGVDMYCWSFLGPRAEALKLAPLKKGERHHLLGFSDKKELRECLRSLKGLQVSIDTSKPVNAACALSSLRDEGRGRYRRPPLQYRSSTSKVEDLVKANILTFKGWMRELA